MAVKSKIKPPPPKPDCRWFAGCPRRATGTTPHPTLGDVPTCDQCHHFATGKERERAKTA